MERGHLLEQKAEGGWWSGEGRPESWDSGGSLRSTPGTRAPTATPNTEKPRLVDQESAAWAAASWGRNVAWAESGGPS